MASKARVGLVGCGNVSTRYARGLSRFDNIVLSGCTDVRQDAAQTFADHFGEGPTKGGAQ